MSGRDHLKAPRRFNRALGEAASFRSDESADTIEIDFSRNQKTTEPLSAEQVQPNTELVVQTMISTMRSWGGPSPAEQAVTERQLQEQKQKVLRVVKRLADAEARAELVVETAPDAFVGVDVEGRILNWNAQASAIFGWTKGKRFARRSGIQSFHPPFILICSDVLEGFGTVMKAQWSITVSRCLHAIATAMNFPLN